MTEPLSVLCLDIEGGHGGSSRSLYEALRAVDRTVVAPEVWCRRGGAIEARYRALDIPVRIEPDLPKVSALPRLSRNLIVSALYLRDFVRSAPARRRLLDAVTTRFDVVHFNHEAFAGLAAWLRACAGVPATMHLRTNLTNSGFARFQQRLVDYAVDQRIFITANEEASYRSQGGKGSGRVIFNPVPLPDQPAPHEAVPRDDRLNVASLSNYAFIRGTDRLVDIALALRETDRIRFVVAGDMTMSPGHSLVDEARQRGVSDSFVFVGHVTEPDRVLAACDCLIKPTREANPWGRDVLEALALGRPVISYGTDATFVETGATGLLLEQFDAAETARHLLTLADDPPGRAQLGQNARERIRSLCDPVRQAHALTRVWQDVAVADRRT